MAVDFMAGRPIGIVDFGAQGIGNALLTHKAAMSDDLRWTWGDKSKPSSVYRDYRFAGTLGGVAAHMFTGRNSLLGRIGLNLAIASGNSLISTETVRRAAEARMRGAGGAAGGGGAPTTAAPPVATAAPAALPDNQTVQGSPFASFATLPGSYA